MTSFRLDTFKRAEQLVELCKEYDDDIDVVWQRYIIDGKSILGVTSLVGKVVTVEILTNDATVKEKFDFELNELQEGINAGRIN